MGPEAPVAGDPLDEDAGECDMQPFENDERSDGRSMSGIRPDRAPGLLIECFFVVRFAHLTPEPRVEFSGNQLFKRRTLRFRDG